MGTDPDADAPEAGRTDKTMSTAERLTSATSEARVIVREGDTVVEDQTPVVEEAVSACGTGPSGAVDVERSGRVPSDVDDDETETDPALTAVAEIQCATEERGSERSQLDVDNARSDEEGAEAGTPGEPSLVTTRSAAGDRSSEGQDAAGSFHSDSRDAVEPAAGSTGDSHSSTTRPRSSSVELSLSRALSLPIRVTLAVAGLAVFAGIWHSPAHQLGHGHIFQPWGSFSRGNQHRSHVPPPPPPGGPFPDMSSVHTLADLLSHLFVPAWGIGRAFRRGCWCDRRSPWFEAVANADRFLDDLSLLEDGFDYVIRIPKARVEELSRASRYRAEEFAHAEARHDRHGTGAFGWFWVPWRRLGWRRFRGRRSNRHRFEGPRWTWGWRHRHHLPPHHHSPALSPHLDSYHPAYRGEDHHRHGHPVR